MLLVGIDGRADFVFVLGVRGHQMKGARVAWAKIICLKARSAGSPAPNTSSSHRDRSCEVRRLILNIVKVHDCAPLVFGDHLVCTNVRIRIKS